MPKQKSRKAVAMAAVEETVVETVVEGEAPAAGEEETVIIGEF